MLNVIVLILGSNGLSPTCLYKYIGPLYILVCIENIIKPFLLSQYIPFASYYHYQMENAMENFFVCMSWD